MDALNLINNLHANSKVLNIIQRLSLIPYDLRAAEVIALCDRIETLLIDAESVRSRRRTE